MTLKFLSLSIVTVALVLVVGSAASAQTIPLSSVVDQESTSSTPPPPPSHSFEFLIGPEASIFFPTSSKTADYYGKSWSSIGVGLGSAYKANAHGSISPFFTVLYNGHDGNSVLLIPFGIGYSKALSRSSTSAYYGFDAVAVAANQSAPEYGINSGYNFGGGARVLLGYEFNKTAYVQASYLEASQIKDLDFSGTSLEVGIRF